MDAPVAIVLAAGKGTRMQSDLPKVLFPVGGRPMILYVLEALRAAGVGRLLVVVGHRADLVREALAEIPDLQFVVQEQQKGTGHAVAVCRDSLGDHDGPVLVVAGDSPMLQPDSVRSLLQAFEETQPACLLGTLHKPDPTGLGRIVRDEQGRFQGIVEELDASPEQKEITEVNMSTYVFDCRRLLEALDQLRPDNRKQEYYLTDCPAILLSGGRRVEALPVLKPCESLSVNTRAELAAVEAELRKMG